MKGKSTLNLPLRFRRITQTLLRYGVGAMILAIPLYPKFPLFNVPGIRVAVRLEDFLILFVFLVLAVHLLPEIQKFFKNEIFRSMLLFWVVTLFGLFCAVYLTQTVSFSVALLNWGRRIEYMVCFFFGYYALKNREDLGFFIKCLLVDVFYVFFVGLGQEFLHWPVITTQNDEYSKGLALFYMKGGHLVSTFAGHYDMAAFLLLLLPLFIVLVFSKKELLSQLFGKFNTSVSRVLLLISVLAGLWLLSQAASRIAVFSYFGVVTLALLLNRKIKVIPIVLVVSLVLVVAFGTSLESRYLNLFDVIYKKVVSQVMVPATFAATIKPVPTVSPEVLVTPSPSPTPVPVLEDRSTNIRLAVEWPRAIRAFEKNPFFGTGYSSITLATDNDYLRTLGETGIFGTLAFALVGFRVLIPLFGAIKFTEKLTIESVFVLCVVAAMPGVLINMVFIDILEASKFATIFWLLLGITVSTLGLIKNKKYEG